MPDTVDNRPFFLDSRRPDVLEEYLSDRGVLGPGERIVQMRSAGNGNMNCTLRVITTKREVVVKQGRPWVEQYPHIPAPTSRTVIESMFYSVVARYPRLHRCMPTLLHHDPHSALLVLEWVDGRGDFTSVYARRRIAMRDVAQLAEFANELHAVRVAPDQTVPFRNLAMRRLNHEHMFVLPLAANNGLDLDGITPGLVSASQALRGDRTFVQEVDALGRQYLLDGPTLVHGDFYPGSWLRHGNRVKVIDPEFTFLGRGEFDFGVMLGHLLIAGCLSAGRRLVEDLLTDGYDRDLVRQFAGVEIMRRILGAAQLPLPRDLVFKQRLLALSRALVVAPETTTW